MRATAPRSQLSKKVLTSIALMVSALGLAYAPLPGSQQTVVVVSGTELQEPLSALEAPFEQANPSIDLQLEFQGSQDVVNDYINDRHRFQPTVLIPANGQLLVELGDRWRAQNDTEPFLEAPRPIAKTVLVGVAWADRGQVLFPDGQFQWQRLEQALRAKNWGAIGGSPEWGSFDFGMTDPTRSNSGQLTLGLMAQSKLGGRLDAAGLNSPAVQSLTALVKRSVYQPARSTDILLEEFITRGPNDADVATVYESVALHRWQASQISKGRPYQIYYLNPTIETTSTAAIVTRHVDRRTATSARQFLDFLTQPQQQAVFVQYGFRPVNDTIELQSVPNSPWTQPIPGIQTTLLSVQPPPDSQTMAEIVRLWQRTE